MDLYTSWHYNGNLTRIMWINNINNLIQQLAPKSTSLGAQGVTYYYNSSTERLTNFAKASPFNWPAAKRAMSMSWWSLSEDVA